MNICEAVSVFIAILVVATAVFDGLKMLSGRPMRPLFRSGGFSAGA